MVLPMIAWRTRNTVMGANDWLTFIGFIYVAFANYVLGYRLYDPPRLAKYLIPQKWIEEWKALSSANKEDIASNERALIGVGVVAILLVLYALTILNR